MAVAAYRPAVMIAPMPAAEPDSDDELVRRAIDGDRGAFGELYTRYARMVHAILIARVPPAEAEDLVQEVFMQAMRKLPLLRAHGAFRGWLGSIARNRAMDYHRGSRQDLELDASSAAQRPGQDSHHDALVALDAIRKLPEAFRETLIMRLVVERRQPDMGCLSVRFGAGPSGLTRQHRLRRQLS